MISEKKRKLNSREFKFYKFYQKKFKIEFLSEIYQVFFLKHNYKF